MDIFKIPVKYGKIYQTFFPEHVCVSVSVCERLPEFKKNFFSIDFRSFLGPSNYLWTL